MPSRCAYVSQLLDILGPSGAEHQSLSIWPNLTDDLANLGFKSHIKHAVCLIHNKVSNPTQVGFLSFEHIDEAPWGGNDNLYTTLQITNLRTFRSSTIDGSVPDSRVRSL